MDKINVLLCRAGKCAEMVEIEDSLEAFHKIVGGMIEEYMPFKDDVAIICNDEGKMRSLPLNRAIKDEDGKIIDVLAGDFFICYAPVESESFLSLPDDLAKKYEEKFKWPEQVFLKNGKGLSAHKYNPDYRKAETARHIEKNDFPKITYERLLDILHDYIVTDLDAATSEYVRDDILRNVCGCTDDEIIELGFECILEK